MTLAMNERADVKTLVAVISRSQIVVARGFRRPRQSSLPENFDATDLAILDWIATEGRRVSRSLLRI